MAWTALPTGIGMALEAWLGEPVVAAQTQSGGMSPGTVARIQTDSGRRVFFKAVGPSPNARSPKIYRREAAIAHLLPTSVPCPRLLWSHDDGEGGWVAMAFEDVDGRQPTLPWMPAELDRVVDCIVGLSEALTPSPLPVEQVGLARTWGGVSVGWWAMLAEEMDLLEDWIRPRLDALISLETGAAAAVDGETLLHMDIRDDNLLLTPDRVMVVDWAHARIGAPWLDIVLMAPSVAMQGGPDPDALIARHPAARAASPVAITAVVAAIAGWLTYGERLPPPPGLPSLPEFVAAQATEARRWLRARVGLNEP